MQLPAIISPDFQDLSSCGSDQELYEKLLGNTDRLTRFFAFAADDETWSLQHPKFYQLALSWFTNQFFRDRLGDEFAGVVLSALHSHYPILEQFIPRPLELQIGEKHIPVNPLMIGMMSPFLRELLRREFNEKALKEMDPVSSEFVLRYLETKDAGDLYRREEKEIVAILSIAERWRVDALSAECQDVLGRYVNASNAVSKLLAAVKLGRTLISKKCMEILNANYTGVSLNSPGPLFLSFEFLNFRDEALFLFEQLKKIITHLKVSGSLTQESPFGKVLKECAHLFGVDVSASIGWSPYFEVIPHSVQELNLARSTWLSDKVLRQLIELLPQISILSLEQDTQLSYVGLGELKKWPLLRELNISRLHQVEDGELSLIMQSVPQLTKLNISSCKKLSDQAFYDLAKRGKNLQQLDASRTSLTDGGLIELGERCLVLEVLHIDHCPNLSHAGLRAFLKVARALRRLSLRENRLDLASLASLQAEFSKLQIEY